ncbi:hypothetical protein BgiBS90_006712 [Biomphalaria glabrata]|nr:hypothetical protein BgiBS90_006712 [Biomphalaria glabrata]
MTNSFFVGKEDLEGGLVHPQGTLLLKISGPTANKANAAPLLRSLSLTPRDAEALYRFENPFLWFLKTNEEKKTQLLNKQFGSNQNTLIKVQTLEEDITKVTLHWLST